MAAVLKHVAVLLLMFAVPVAAGDDALSLTLGVPASEGGRRIDATGSGPHFHVILANRSAASQRVWQEHYSWGYYALHLELRNAQERVSVIRKARVGFTRNIPLWWSLEAGEQLPLDVHLGDSRIWDIPLGTLPRGCGQLRLKAVFEVTPDSESQKHTVWTGRIESAEQSVTVCR